MGHHEISVRKTGALDRVDNQRDTYLLRIYYRRIYKVQPATVEMQSMQLELRLEELEILSLADFERCLFQQRMKLVHPPYKSLCLCDPATSNFCTMFFQLQ